MQTISLPQTLRIGPYDYDVNPPGSRLSSDLSGSCDTGLCEIVVDTDHKPIVVAVTYLHEVLHGIYHASGLNETSDEEAIVESFSVGLVSFMRDNADGLRPIYDALGGLRRRFLEDKLNTGGPFS